MARDDTTLTHLPDGPTHAREDELLAIRCQLGERAAFEELIRRWNDPLWRYVRRIAGEDDGAADLVQEIWLRVIRGMSRLREPARLRPWLFGIARRVAMDRLRQRYAAPPLADVDALDAVPGPEPGTLDDDLDALDHELGRLPILEREVLTLFYLQELSLAEVADVLAVPTGTVKSRLFRARQLLRTQLMNGKADRHD